MQMTKRKRGNRNKTKDTVVRVNMNDEPPSILEHMKLTKTDSTSELITQSDDTGQQSTESKITTANEVEKEEETEIADDEEVIVEEDDEQVTQDEDDERKEDAEEEEEVEEEEEEEEVEDEEEEVENEEEEVEEEEEEEVEEEEEEEEEEGEEEEEEEVEEEEEEEEEVEEGKGVQEVTVEEGDGNEVIQDNSVLSGPDKAKPILSKSKSDVLPENESDKTTVQEKTTDNTSTKDIRVLFSQSQPEAITKDASSQISPEVTTNEVQTDQEDGGAVIPVTQQDRTPVRLEVNKGSPSKNKYFLMGLTSVNDTKRVFRATGVTTDRFQPLSTTNDKLTYNLNNSFEGNFRMPSDPVLTQRTALYQQSFQSGGLCLNPAYHRIQDNKFVDYFEKANGSVFLFLERMKPQARCLQAAKRHGIRGGRPERELQVDGQIFYTKSVNHPFWLDVLRLLQRRYNQTVPKGERIDSISKYGRNYLGGADLITEAYARNQKKYNDVVIVGRDVYNAFFSKVQ